MYGELQPGTPTTEKLANIPISAQLAALILGGGLGASDQAHVAELEAEAERFNAIAAALERQKMQQTLGELNPKMAAARGILEAAVREAAWETVANSGMDKEAFGAFLSAVGRGAGAALKGIGGAVQAAGRLQLPTAARSQFQQAWQGATAAQKAPGRLGQAGGWLQQKGSNLAARSQRPMPLPTTVTQPAVAPGKSAPLLSAGTKAKMIGGGALLGAGYLGMKTLQTGRDYMMQGPGATYGHGTPIMNNVNQFGYAQY